MKSKKEFRLRRAARTRRKIRELTDVRRLCVHKTPRHIYCQITTADGSKTLASVSTLDKALRQKSSNGNKESAAKVGKLIGEAAKKIGISRVAFDRSGFKYHGRIKSLADAAREAGLEF